MSVMENGNQVILYHTIGLVETKLVWLSKDYAGIIICCTLYQAYEMTYWRLS